MIKSRIRIKKSELGLIVLALFCLYVIYQIFSPQFTTVAEKKFKIARGDNVFTIAQNLKLAGVIKDRLAFLTLTFLKASFLDLKAGQYAFEPGLDMVGVLNKIERGEALLGENEVYLGIAEGLNLKEVSGRINEIGPANIDLTHVKATNFTHRFAWLAGMLNPKYNTLEGFLFPDTYRIEKGTDINAVVRKVLKNFDAKTVGLKQ